MSFKLLTKPVSINALLAFGLELVNLNYKVTLVLVDNP